MVSVIRNQLVLLSTDALLRTEELEEKKRYIMEQINNGEFVIVVPSCIKVTTLDRDYTITFSNDECIVQRDI